MRFLAVMVIGVLMGAQVAAQPGNTDREIRAHALGETRLELDGKVTETFWTNIAPSDEFRMTVPVEGGDPTERTEIRIAFDEENLYIAAIFYDSDPSGIKAFQRKRDASLRTDDRFMWIMDTFNDKRRAYMFEINPRALRGDALLAAGQGTNINKDWDGIWKAWTYIGDFGWSAEIKIPFRSVNFDPKSDQWGINFQRTIRRNNEELVWSGYKRNQGLFRPQNAGILTGLQDPSQGIGLEVIPYGLAQTTADRQDDGVMEAANNAEFGFDVNYNITPSLKASFTYNTDFAQTEVDDRQINLSRFPLRFPEKRDFFLEGSSILQFAPRNGADPYFSRRIGLSGGQPVPIQYGGRLLGNVGKNNVYALHVRTAAVEDQKMEDFSVGRYRRDFWKESSVGIIYTRRDTEGDDMLDSLHTRHTMGVDLNLATSEFLGDNVLQFAAFWVGHNTHSPFDDSTSIGDRSVRGVRLNFPNQPWSGSVSYREFGNHYDPAVGFNRRNGFRRLQPRIQFNPLFEESNVIRSVEWGIYYEYLASLENKLLTENIRFTLGEVRFESGERIEMEISRNFEFLDEPFDILRDGSVIVPPGDYVNWQYEVGVSSASFRKISGYVGIEGGDFWSGQITSYEAGLTLRPIPGINLGAEYAYSNVTAEDGGFKINLYRIDLGFDFTPDLSLSSNIQYDDVSTLVGTNTRFRWIITPGTDVFLVYNHNWLNPQTNPAYTTRRGLALKAVYTHRF